MARAKRNKPHNPAKVHDRRSRDLPRNAEVAAVEVDDPLALEPGEKIVTLRSIRNDPLARLHTHRQVDEAQYQGGRAFQHDWEKAERGPQAVDPTREYVDGGQKREPITEGQRKAVLRLNRAERELGADGSALVHEVLILGMTMEQIGQRRGLRGQRWIDYLRVPRPAGADLWIRDGAAVGRGADQIRRGAGHLLIWRNVPFAGAVSLRGGERLRPAPGDGDLDNWCDLGCGSRTGPGVPQGACRPA